MRKSFVTCLIAFALSTVISLAASTGSIFQIRLVVDNPSDDADRMIEVIHGNHESITNALYVQKAVLLDITALKSAKVDKDPRGNKVVTITFTPQGAKQFADVTRQNINKRIAIIVEGQVCETPRIGAEISGGEVWIAGSYTDEQMKDLAKKLNDATSKK